MGVTAASYDPLLTPVTLAKPVLAIQKRHLMPRQYLALVSTDTDH